MSEKRDDLVADARSIALRNMLCKQSTIITGSRMFEHCGAAEPELERRSPKLSDQIYELVLQLHLWPCFANQN